MKLKLKLSIITLVIVGLTSCDDPGTTQLRLNGNESNLPDELKGLKIYSVATDGGHYVKVAILNNQINSTTCKHTQSLILVNKQDNKLIEVSSVLMENDSLIICRK